MLCHKNNRGFSLVELMVAIVISTILITAVSATYIAQNRSYIVQESVSEINTQAKIALDVIANDIKTAGFGVPSDMNQNPINGLITVVTLIDNVNAPDAITITGGFRMLGTLWPNGVGPASNKPCPGTVVPLGSSSVNIEYDGSDTFNTADKSFISIDGINYARVTGVADNTIALDRPLSQDFPLLDLDGDLNNICDTGRPVYVIEDTTFCVDGNAILRRIRRNADINTCTAAVNSDDDELAENIEDLQFAYAVDADNDGLIDDQNGDNVINDSDYITGALVLDPATIRAIRVNVLAKSGREDDNYKGLGNPPAVIENRQHAPTNDNFRRRWWRTVVNMKNQ